jgi:hypothetical protein
VKTERSGTPAQKAAAWKVLSLLEGKNPFRADAMKRAQAWEAYEERQKELTRQAEVDWTKLEKVLPLEVVSAEQKKALVAQFKARYGALPEYAGKLGRVTGECPAGMAAIPGGTNAAGTKVEFCVSADTVAHLKTGLQWQRVVPSQAYNWADAKAYCSGLSLGGQTGWRLPTIKELETVVDRSVDSCPKTNVTAFPDTPCEVFYSSSPYAHDSPSALGVDFSSGDTDGTDNAGHLRRVRCVR